MSEVIFFEIGQDGIGYLDKDNSFYSGLCTFGLDTCMALVFRLNSGIVLVHDTGQLDAGKVVDFVFSKGSVERIQYYEKQKLSPDPGNRAAQQHNCKRRIQYNKLCETKMGKKALFSRHYTSKGSVYVERNGNASIDDPGVSIEQVENYSFRNAIGKCNNMFSPCNCQDLLPDIQFDKEQNYTLPNLRYSRKKMDEIVFRKIEKHDLLAKFYLKSFEELEQATNDMSDERMSKMSVPARVALGKWFDIQIERQD